jgi:hypothetical protein
MREGEKVKKSPDQPVNDESPAERIARLTNVGAFGALAPQFYRDHPTDTSDLRERIISGDYFKADR